MDKVTREIQDEVILRNLFTNDIVLIDEIRDGVNNMLEWWQYTLECVDFELSKFKTEYLRCGLNGTEEAGGEVTIDGAPIPRVEKFKYLRPFIKEKDDIDEDINQRIKWVDKNGGMRRDCYVIREFL